MPDEKRIERWNSDDAWMASGIGEYVKYDDHLDALGEAEKRASKAESEARYERERSVENRKLAREDRAKLETLRSGLDDASLIPCRQCRTAEYEAEWKRLRERSEDTEKQSGGGEDRG